MVFSAARRAGIGLVMGFSVSDVSHDRSGRAGRVANFLRRQQILALTSGDAVQWPSAGRPRRAAPSRSCGGGAAGSRALLISGSTEMEKPPGLNFWDTSTRL